MAYVMYVGFMPSAGAGMTPSGKREYILCNFQMPLYNTECGNLQ